MRTIGTGPVDGPPSIAEIYDKLFDLRASARKIGEVAFKKNSTKASHCEEDLKKEQRVVDRTTNRLQKEIREDQKTANNNERRLQNQIREDKKAADIAERRRVSDLQKETKELARLASIAETTCECGVIYIFNRRSVHMGSDKHRDRMDGIQYCKQLHNL